MVVQKVISPIFKYRGEIGKIIFDGVKEASKLKRQIMGGTQYQIDNKKTKLIDGVKLNRGVSFQERKSKSAKGGPRIVVKMDIPVGLPAKVKKDLGLGADQKITTKVFGPPTRESVIQANRYSNKLNERFDPYRISKVGDREAPANSRIDYYRDKWKIELASDVSGQRTLQLLEDFKTPTLQGGQYEQILNPYNNPAFLGLYKYAVRDNVVAARTIKNREVGSRGQMFDKDMLKNLRKFSDANRVKKHIGVGEESVKEGVRLAGTTKGSGFAKRSGLSEKYTDSLRKASPGAGTKPYRESFDFTGPDKTKNIAPESARANNLLRVKMAEASPKKGLDSRRELHGAHYQTKEMANSEYAIKPEDFSPNIADDIFDKDYGTLKKTFFTSHKRNERHKVKEIELLSLLRNRETAVTNAEKQAINLEIQRINKELIDMDVMTVIKDPLAKNKIKYFGKLPDNRLQVLQNMTDVGGGKNVFGKEAFAEGGSTGIQPVENPTQKFDIQVKQMMDTSGLDFADSIIEVMKDMAKRQNFNVGGMAGNKYGGFALDEESLGNKVGALESLLAGIGAGLIDIPKGAFTLGAALMDVGFGTNNSAKMEAWFDDLTDFDEKAEQHWLGSFARIATNLGVPGAYGFKAGERLARNALLAKRNGNYFKLTDPVLQEKFKTSLNAKGRLLATLGGAAGVGATDAIFVGDPEGVGTFGDMIGAGPTELDPNDENLASREIANRVRFGVDGALFLGLIGGTGSAVKSLARRRDELASNNDALDKFFSVFRPRGKKSQAFFDMERQNIGARAGDINFAGEQARKLDKHIDAIFPFVKNPFNKLGNKGRAEFMDKLNDTLLSGEIRMDASGKVNFGAMDKKLVDEVTQIMRKKNAKKEDIEGVFDSFEQMRLGWGHIFSRLGYSMDDAARSEFKALFGNKFKSYLGSTYEIFQNKSLLPFLRYKPTEEAVEKTIKLFMDSASEAGKPITRGEAELFVNRAIETVKMPRDIATSKEKTTGIYFDAPEFFANKTVLDEVELGKKTVAFDDLAEDSKKIMAELFGKVSDPMQTMLTGTNRLSLIGRRNQFFNDLIKADDVLVPKRAEFLKANPGKPLPKELKGFFRETEAEAVEAFGGNIKKIEIDPTRTIEAGITNPVNGKYAERGVAEALEEASQVAADKSTLAQMYESFILYPKATSQLAKTVLSPITHVRNFVSAGAFATANGLIPGLVSPEDFGKAFKEAFGQLQIPGARMDNERYRELLRLGVVNSNVRLGDLQRLLKDTNFGESVNSRKALRELMRPFSKFKKFTEDLYTAEDDFWKLTSFALERQRLGRAYEKYGIAKTAADLDEEAADIIRNNIPNYDMVNDFIKATRKLPLGNFVSFPAEIMRTTANILNRSLQEIRFEHTLSDGRIVKPLQGIGYKRLFGMGTTVVGVPYATSEAFKAIYDVTEDEMQALRRFVPDWSKNSTILPIRGDDGKLKYIDFSHANAYDTMIRPINSMIIGVQRGMEEGELAKEVLKSMYEGTKETLSPFFSESIWTNALSDIVIRNGRTREGRRLYTDQTPWGERVNKSLLHLAETQFPGSIASFQRLDLAFEPVDILKKGKFDEYGNTFNIPDEALGFIGMRAVEVDPVKAMKFKIADFRTGINNARREFTSPLLKGGAVTPQQIAERYQIASESLYNVQEKMFRDYFAAMRLGSKVEQLDREFADRVSNVQLRAIKRGEFKPFIPSENIEDAFAENARALGQPNPYVRAKPFINNLIRLYDRIPFGVGLPNIRNPFQQQSSLPITQSPAFQGIQITPGTTFGGLPQAGNQQTLTAMKGQKVFGATDPIFGVG